jgi:hypothetical protein
LTDVLLLMIDLLFLELPLGDEAPDEIGVA